MVTSTLGEQMIDRLSGYDPRDLARIRRMSYYSEWKAKAKWLRTASPKEILYAIHWAKDDRSYGYAWKSEKSAEALDLVLREEGLR